MPKPKTDMGIVFNGQCPSITTIAHVCDWGHRAAIMTHKDENALMHTRSFLKCVFRFTFTVSDLSLLFVNHHIPANMRNL